MSRRGKTSLTGRTLAAINDRLMRDAAAAPTPEVGKKFDKGKLRFSLFPIEALNPILEVLEHGAEKYGEGNWRLLEDPRTRYADALHRHFVDYLLGVKFDKDSKLPTLAHLACDAIFLLAFDIKDRLS
jgi:hypothetical protein